MKVLFCTNTFQNIYHGPAKFANYLLDLNKYDGIELKILTEDVQKSTKQIYKASIPISERWKKIGMVTRTYDYYNEARKIRKEFPFDILIFNHAMIALQSAKKLKKVKVVGMINDENSSSLNWKNIKWSSYFIRQYIFKYFEQRTTKKADLILVNSKYLKQEVVKQYEMSKKKVKVLYKGISFEPITPNRNRKKLSEKKVIQIFFMKSDPVISGLQNLINALNLLEQFNFNVIIVGPSKYFINTLETKKHVALDSRGKQAQIAVFEIMKGEADIFCVPSIKEGLGVANIEALAHCLPVVSSNAGGIPEVLNYGENGWLAQKGDANSLAQEIKNCITKDKERISKSERGYIYAKENFNKSQVLDNFSAILNDVFVK